MCVYIEACCLYAARNSADYMKDVATISMLLFRYEVLKRRYLI